MGLIFKCSASLLLLSVSIFIGYSSAREQPHIACPNHFRYDRWGDQWVGIISVHPGSTNLSLTVQFSLQGVQNTDAIGTLEPHPDEETVKRNLVNGKSVEYAIRLYGTGSLPKLTKLELNDNLLCEAEGYGPPTTLLIRIQKVYVYTATSSSVSGGEMTMPNLNNLNLNIPFFNGLDLRNFNFNSANFQNFLNNMNAVGTQSVQGDQCGQEGLVPFMHGGEEIDRGRFPWLVAVVHNTGSEFAQKCSGSLVSRRSVITAAHCVFEVETSRIRAYLGRHDLGVNGENGAVLMELERIITHPDYTRHIIPEADVAVLILNSPAEYSQFIRPICIWGGNDFIGSDNGQQGSVAGWGIDENGNKPPRPKAVNVFTVSQATCLRDMAGAKDFVTDRTLCAGNRMSHGPCLGDSGGGLMIKRSNRWMLRAIISLGSRAGDQCDLSQYVIYCDLAKHINWVQSNVVH